MDRSKEFSTMPYWRLFYHFVWSTREKEPLIEAMFEEDLHNAIAAKAKKMGAFVYAVGGTEDHIHLAVSVPPKLAPAEFIRQIKGTSSYFVNSIFEPPVRFSWQREYGVVSFGAKRLDMVVKYIKNQKQHHTQNTTILFLEQIEATDNF